MVLRFVVDVHTTCFSLHGHLQVCKIFYFLVLKESVIEQYLQVCRIFYFLVLKESVIEQYLQMCKILLGYMFRSSGQELSSRTRGFGRTR
jgi:hypothetical protein